MVRRMLTIIDVAEQRLCTGCGTCTYLAPDLLRMVDDVEQGRRPVLRDGAERSATAPLVDACPGAALRAPRPDVEAVTELQAGWGNVLELWEGHAGEESVRFRGSSGGTATALAIHALESGDFHGVLHTGARPDLPFLNETVLSRTPAEVLAHAGSRYSPASPCDALDLVEAAPGPCVVIGKPCDIAGLHLARRARPRLDANVGLTIAVFCAGTPSTRGTIEMLHAMGYADEQTIASLRYRGHGWPGSAAATAREGQEPALVEFDYDQSWNRILQKHRQWRCHLCPDHTGEYADIAVGDAWHRPIEAGDPGRSLVLARTGRGRTALAAAAAVGAVVLRPAPVTALADSQPNLVRTRGAVAARVATLQVLGVAAPRFRGFSMWRFWWTALSLRAKVSSTLGTARRVKRRGLRRPLAVREHHGWSSSAGTS